MTDLWLIRHGQTDWNVEGRWQGQAPQAPGLNEAGRAQSRSMREQLNEINFTAVYSSDLLRARQTAEILAEPSGISVILEPRLREINLGAWEGMLSTEIQSRYPEELAARERDPYHSRAPGGELPSEVAGRVFEAADDIAARHPRDSVLVVSHGVSLAMIICRAGEIPLEQVYELIPENASPLRVQWLVA